MLAKMAKGIVNFNLKLYGDSRPSKYLPRQTTRNYSASTVG